MIDKSTDNEKLLLIFFFTLMLIVLEVNFHWRFSSDSHVWEESENKLSHRRAISTSSYKQ